MNQDLQIFTSIVISVFLEASPFLVLGALLSALFEVYLPQGFIERYVPKGRLSGLAFGLSAGMLFPTCECGVVSIVRRFLRRGVPSHVAISYMLSAPVINPLVLTSTYIAFRGDIWMVLARVLMVAVTAAVIGLALSNINPLLLLREGRAYTELFDSRCSGDECIENHHANHGFFEMAPGCGCGCEAREGSRLSVVLAHTASEFLDMGKYLILGALAVGSFHVLLPPEFLSLFETSTLLAIGGMMLMAVLLSVCSEADAFVAASFSSFPKVAQLSFVTVGPMVDLKLIVMYGAVFHRRIALMLIIVPIFLIYLLSLLMQWVVE